MKPAKSLLLLLLVFGVFSCSPYRVVTSLKIPNVPSRPYAKLLVVGIINDTSLLLRQNMENHLVGDLKGLGYTAVSALEEFGPKGLANLAEEQTYLALCNKGIDGVITIALIDRHKEQTNVPAQKMNNTNIYYYNRIWNYQKIQANLVALPSETYETTAYRWESIFFDLATLEPVYIIQTKSFDFASIKDQAHLYGQSMVSNMLKKKVLFPQNKAANEKYKVF